MVEPSRVQWLEISFSKIKKEWGWWVIGGQEIVFGGKATLFKKYLVPKL